MQLLINKNIIVACTGSIAVYKTLELIRLYIKAGANVKVILTQSAKKFITPLSFETISQNIILDDTNENWDKNSINNHIAIGKWADILIIAPATANTINKLANGIADNILLQAVLAYPHKILLSPAANTNMIHNPITKQSIKKLEQLNFEIVNSQVKELACRDIGDGAMADINDIYHTTVKELLKDDYWLNRKAILSGGGTIEKIDDVRYISNFSSGKMAANLATALYYKGANVSLISTKEIEIPNQIKFIKVTSTEEMYREVKNSTKSIETSKKPYFFSVAAVSDYVPAIAKNGKLKKDIVGNQWDLQLHQNTDILHSIDKKDIYTVGFKAELDIATAKDNALKMLEKKNIDAVCLNIIDKENNFGSDTNEIELITKKESINLKKDSKLNISLNILNQLKEQFYE